MIEPGKVFTEEQKAAIEVLIKAGFVAFVDAKIEDVRELGTGRRQATWRHQKRYAMVLALQDDPSQPRKPSLMEKARADRIAAKKRAEKAVPGKKLEDMSKPELLAEAEKLPRIVGAKSMNKPDLLAAILAEQKRRELIHMKFQA